MFCQNCKKNEATVYYKKTVNNHSKEYHLCPACAENMEREGVIDFRFPFEFDSLFNQMMELPFIDPISLLGFDERSYCPSLGMIHSLKESRESQTHPENRTETASEKSPCTGCANTEQDSKAHPISKEAQIQELQKKMDRAVETQEFEKAAEYRDEIKKLKESA